MLDLFDFEDYHEFLLRLLSKKKGQRGFQAELAKHIGCQASYLIQVSKGKAELTEDHLLRLARFLKLKEGEIEYLFLLLRISKASSLELKEFLRQKRVSIQRTRNQMNREVGARALQHSDEFIAQYFSNSYTSLVHIACSSKNFQTPKNLAARFGLTVEEVTAILQLLERNKLVHKNSEGRYVFEGGSIHLPKESNLNEVHQINRRLQGIRSLQRNGAGNLHFSSIFTLDESAFQKLKKMVTEFVETSHELIHQAGADEVYAMTLDAFRVP